MRKINLILLGIFCVNSLYSQAVLNADGPGNTYELINSVLAPNGNVVEVPDCGHEEFGRHIDEVYDSALQNYVFRFHIHVTPDNDRCKNYDRQRNEIKTYSASPDSLLGTVGETHEYKWKFKLDSNFQSSSSFTHIHQLKAVGGAYESMPLITLTTRKGTPDKLELRYAAEVSQSTITKVDLDPLKGTWVQATEKVTYSNPGTYSISLVKIDSGEELFNYSSSTLNMYKEGAEFMRPKWGIYRSLNDSASLRDEMLLYADFWITETLPVVEVDTIKPTVVLSSTASEPISAMFTVDAIFSETIVGFSEDDIVVNNGAIVSGSFSGSDQEYSFLVKPIATGNVTININEGAVTDSAGNENTAANELVVVADISSSTNEMLRQHVRIYPNPSNGIINIVTAGTGLLEVNVIDQSGRTIYSINSEKGNIHIDLSKQKKGLYILKLKSDNKLHYSKIVLE